jgi:hypothetical protein
VSAGKHHTQTVIRDDIFARRGIDGFGVRGNLFHQERDLVFFVAKDLVAANEIERQVFCNLCDPGGRDFLVCRNKAKSVTP